MKLGALAEFYYTAAEARRVLGVDESTFQYWGLPSNTSLTWNGNNTYVGTVYAPETDFSCGGGGSTAFDFQGACVVNTLSLNGHFSFHFDENLSRLGIPTGFTIISWKEL